jgi:hypothetical protein
MVNNLKMEVPNSLAEFAQLSLGSIFYCNVAGATQIGMKTSFTNDGKLPGIVYFTTSDDTVVPQVKDAENCSNLHTLLIPAASIRASCLQEDIREGSSGTAGALIVTDTGQTLLRCLDVGNPRSTRDIDLGTGMISTAQVSKIAFWFAASALIVPCDDGKVRELVKIMAIR